MKIARSARGLAARRVIAAPIALALLLAAPHAVDGADIIAFSSLCQHVGSGNATAIPVPNGYWTSATASELTPSSVFHPCLNPDACLPAEDGGGGDGPAGGALVRCNEAEGYKAGGVLCGECAGPHYVQVGTRCARCMMPHSANVVAIVGVGIVVVIFLFVLAWPVPPSSTHTLQMLRCGRDVRSFHVSPRLYLRFPTGAG